jgi:hypothetical protein
MRQMQGVVCDGGTDERTRERRRSWESRALFDLVEVAVCSSADW